MANRPKMRAMRVPMFETVFFKGLFTYPEERKNLSWIRNLDETTFVEERLGNTSEWREGRVLLAYEALALAAAEVARIWPEDSKDVARTKAGHRAEEHSIAVAAGAVYSLVDSQFSRWPAELRLGTPEGREFSETLENMQANFLETLLMWVRVRLPGSAGLAVNGKVFHVVTPSGRWYTHDRKRREIQFDVKGPHALTWHEDPTHLLLTPDGLDSITKGVGLNRNTRTIPTSLYDTRTKTVITLTEPTEYVALSYCWDQWSKEKLRAELEQVATVTGITRVWIDQWCINQDDPVEKAREIAKMGDYYEGASLTVILAPDCTPGDVLAGKLDSEVLLFPYCRMDGPMNWKECKWNTRVWTLQEARLSPNATVKTRDGYVNLWTLEQVTQALNAGARSWHPHRSEELPTYIFWAAKKTRKSFLCSYNRNPLGVKTRHELELNYWQICQLLRKRHCDDSRDRLLGVSSIVKGIVVNEIAAMTEDEMVDYLVTKSVIPPITLLSNHPSKRAGRCWSADKLEQVEDQVARYQSYEKLMRWDYKGRQITPLGAEIIGIAVTLERWDGTLVVTHRGKKIGVCKAGEEVTQEAILMLEGFGAGRTILWGEKTGQNRWHKTAAGLMNPQDVLPSGELWIVG
ncbi:hypothetical protein F5Y19DRAFT_429863 [Xylariaceae sp. FL1651]|nr:hypothetical protein F5Y19DRAFT_429863 [Xylariaceae sp. FL1651]